MCAELKHDNYLASDEPIQQIITLDCLKLHTEMLGIVFWDNVNM